MKEKEFDILMRSRLENYESPVPAGMWDRITIAGGKRKKGFIKRLSLLTIAFLLIGLTAIFYTFNKHHQIASDAVSNKNNPTDIAAVKKNLTRSNNKDDHSISSLDVVKDQSAGAITDAKGNHKASMPLTKNEKRKKKSYSRQQKFSPVDRAVADNSNPISDGTNNNSPGNLTKKETPKEGTTTASSEPAEKAERTPVESGSDKFSVELFTSPSVPINSISSDNKAYEDALKGSSSMQLSYTVGLRMSYAISKRISAKIGVQYSQVNEKMNFTDPVGNNFTSTNRYKNIGIPLVLGYKITSMSDLDFFVNTGIILNIVSQYKGIIPSASGQPIDIKNENVYNTNASAALYLGINLSKKMNNRTDFFAEPWINYRFKNMVSHYYSFDQKINTLGLSLGLRYRLYKIEMPR